jgi:biopolymer transport protein ExbD
MRGFRRARGDESSYELNLAPLLDIIVSIVPMLLLSVVFVRITMIDTPVPQVVEKAIAAANEKMKDQVSITLAVAKTGFRFTINDQGKTKEQVVAAKDGKLDFDGLHKETVALKKTYPQVFRLELSPDSEVELTDIVRAMDKVRMLGKDEGKLKFTDVTSGKPLETDLMFPDITFGNIAGG